MNIITRSSEQPEARAGAKAGALLTPAECGTCEFFVCHLLVLRQFWCPTRLAGVTAERPGQDTCDTWKELNQPHNTLSERRSGVGNKTGIMLESLVV